MAAVAEAANREEAEKAYARAESLFVAGDVPGARRMAIRARRLSPSLPGVAHALGAYDIHAAATWHAILGLDGGGGGQRQPARVDEEAVKRQFRRRSLLVHPDKNRSAAAEGAFKLLRQACDALLSSGPGPCYTRPAPYGAAAEDWFRTHHATKKNRSPSPPPSPPRPPSWSRRRKRGRERKPYCSAYYFQPAYAKPGSRTETAAPGKPRPPTFPCPAACPHCQARFTSEVSAGHWMQQCKACLKSAMVHVRGPDEATCTK
ncbi:hypothetical protein BRADI_1g02465v3 [Brachypodium distachyon]|uniref:J domain-containing protein n=1 Tax=Brachypodium distachyon TaxID=15368 RepID=A0A0Q3JJ44_BRADI|nr:hypothetical protein BRADI_1g02465v3 [Brachypodium distachyon]